GLTELWLRVRQFGPNLSTVSRWCPRFRLGTLGDFRLFFLPFEASGVIRRSTARATSWRARQETAFLCAMALVVLAGRLTLGAKGTAVAAFSSSVSDPSSAGLGPDSGQFFEVSPAEQALRSAGRSAQLPR